MATPTPIETAIMGALERLAAAEAQSARTARDAKLKDDAAFFQRAANAYANALRYYLSGLRPTPTPNGWMLPSQRPGEAPHLLTRDGDWICTCPAGQSMHWAKALIVGIEVGYDDIDQFGGDGGDSGPILVTGGDGGVTLQRGDTAIDCRAPADVAQAIGALISRAVPPEQPADDFSDVDPIEPRARSLIDRLAAARAQRLAA